MTLRTTATLLLALAVWPAVQLSAETRSPRALYARALEREQLLRDAERAPTLLQLRRAVNAYDAIVRRFPASSYSDNALWQAANLAMLAYERFGDASDQRTASRLLAQLRKGYPSSSLVPRAAEMLRQTAVVGTSGVPRSTPTPVAGTIVGADPDEPPPTAIAPRDDEQTPAKADPTAAAVASTVSIRDITRTPLPDGMRVTIEMDGESAFRSERLDRPRRVFFDLKGARPVASLQDATIRFTDEVVREIRLGRHPQNTTRIVMDMEGAESYSVFTLYNPFRLVVDFKAAAGPKPIAGAAATSGPMAPADTRATVVSETRIPDEPRVVLPLPPPPLPPITLAMKVPATPAPSDATSKLLASRPLTSPLSTLPSANSDGKFSLARQLGLGVSRIVIDAGHGGHDPGAHGNGIVEAELVLDVAQRLSKLLQKQTGMEVVMTRDADVFIPLEERTAIANREGADLFLSIHANASRNTKARGIETYFLNFASNPDAEAVAARENSGSSRSMHSLPEIVRAIALNNKIDESRDFADAVQRSMVRRLTPRNGQLKDLGVKQAPFVVLIGAAMPSVLAEISFVTHKQEGQLLKTPAYRQQIAEALLDAVVRYQQSLKKIKAGTAQVGAREN